jgi:hypothetical protein
MGMIAFKKMVPLSYRLVHRHDTLGDVSRELPGCEQIVAAM